MTDRWFDDLPEHDPEDPEAVERALRRQERAAKRAGSSRRASGRKDHEPVRDRSDRRPYGRRPHPARADRSNRARLIGLGLAGLVAIAIIWFCFALFQPFAGNGEGDPFEVTIPPGSSVGDIGRLLADEGVVSNGAMFEIRATLSGRRGSLSEGSHAFRRNMSYSAALDEMEKTTAKKTITVAIPEGLSRSETAETVAAAGLSGDYMKATVSSPDFNPRRYGAPKDVKSLEGFLFPATYELKPNATVDALVEEQLKAFSDNFATVDMKYARKKNLTAYDVLTIASMIEREVAVPKERRMVAAVIYNRLKMGEPLFIDATIRYATGNWQKPLTESELAVDSPYNTRTSQGLPPGPIGSPGLAAIKAAANPARTDAWLYVVKPGTCGEHVFSSSLEEHNRNVEAYQQAQEEAGGSPTECP
ncbi:MAG: endolytic transglycosylase MltG [Solirubrobacterales bacterium]|nr:endolytic transglycosylase MltG [Solirubrobacterales bacterium]